MSRTARIVICAASLIALGGSAAADESAAAPTASATDSAAATTPAHHAHHKTLDSQTFTTDAAVAGETEIQASQLAQSKSGSDDVKDFAQRMITDHTKVGMQLMDIASRDNLTVPTALDSAHQKEIDRLNAVSAADFDAAYARQMVRDHYGAVALFRRASKAGSAINDDLKTFAKDTLPTLEQHLKLARKLESAHGRHAATAK